MARGFDEAYKTSSGTYYDPHNKSYYVAGTRNIEDVATDIKLASQIIPQLPYYSKIPSYDSTLKRTKRYKQIEQDILNYPEAQVIYGHSLAGSMAQAYQNAHPELLSVSVNAPVFAPKNRNQYLLKSIYDPVSFAAVSRVKTQGKYYGHKGIPATFGGKYHGYVGDAGEIRLAPQYGTPESKTMWYYTY